MTLTPVRRLALVFVALALVLIGAVVNRAIALQRGQEVVMQAGGYDPRAPLLGHYLAIAPTPNTLRSTAAYGRDFEPGQRLWLVMTPGKELGAWSIIAVGSERPTKLAPGQIAARARFLRTEEDYTEGDPPPSQRNATLWFDWGINRIYLDERRAREIEKRQSGAEESDPPPQLRLILSIGRDGVLMTKGLMIDDLRLVEPLF
jgi:uncharacterized membrane-anchored protein